MKKYPCTTKFMDDLLVECDKLMTQLWDADEKTKRYLITHMTEFAILSLVKKHDGVAIYNIIKVGDNNEEEQEG